MELNVKVSVSPGKSILPFICPDVICPPSLSGTGVAVGIAVGVAVRVGVPLGVCVGTKEEPPEEITGVLVGGTIVAVAVGVGVAVPVAMADGVDMELMVVAIAYTAVVVGREIAELPSVIDMVNL
jgi:hypothetical protein